MLKIRLQRVGKVHEPVYRLVLTDSKNGPKSGKFLEILGNFDSRQKDQAVLKEERIKELIKNGAQPSDTVHNLFIDRKIITGKKINKLPKKTVQKADKPEAEISKPEAEAPRVEEAAPENTETPEPEAAPADTEVAQ